MNKKVLIIEDEVGLADMYKFKLEREGFKVFTAYDGVVGIDIAKKEKPDLILLDIIMPGLNGFEVLRDLRADPITENTKVFVFSNLGQNEEIERGLQEGADKYLIKANMTPGQLVEKIEETFKTEKTAKKENTGKKINTNLNDLKQEVKNNSPRVLLIEDVKEIIEIYDLCLNQSGFKVDIARNGAWGMKLARENSYDVIVMDIMMPAMNGLEMLKKLKSESLHQNIPIIILSNSAQDNDIAEAKENGAVAYLLKSMTTPTALLKEINKNLKK